MKLHTMAEKHTVPHHFKDPHDSWMGMKKFGRITAGITIEPLGFYKCMNANILRINEQNEQIGFYCVSESSSIPSLVQSTHHF